MIHKNIPNILSVIRILLTPLFVFFMLKGESSFIILSFFLVFTVSITDFFDGYYARRFNLVTTFGKYIDPLADKFFILTVFFTLYYLYSDYISLWMIVLIVLRDIFIMALRNIFNNKGFSFITSKFAKYKTAIQIISIHIILLILILNEYSIWNLDMNIIYYVMFICVVITLATGIDYFLYYFKQKKNEI